MRITVSSQNFRTVTGHAGRARRFIVFEANGQEPPRQVERLDLDANMAIHGYDHGSEHPLDRTDVLITSRAAGGFIRHMGARGVRVVATDESVPELAVQAFLEGRAKSDNEDCHHDHCDGGADKHIYDGGEQSHSCNCHR